jgi:hypothetical protein
VGLAPFSSVSCPSATNCAAVGFRAPGIGNTAAFSTDGGESWK